ncbi:hypothetical protein G9A89_023947 [Geosiphon pyriformis]|nr:hypothetical protein G9A89_023947 [Geosiphon pyriformis]
MTDFGLTNDYQVFDGLNQEEVFSPLLWHIFYDPLLCEVKCQGSVCDYRLNSHFVSKSSHTESQAGLFFFFTVGVFVDDTIWIGSSQAATQHILDIASEFFRVNDISINNDKTVAILINCRVSVPSLFISGLPISVARRGESYQYLGIFLSTEGFLKLSLAKAHLDVHFFINLVLKKAVSDKQFLYLVSAVLHFIIGYKMQFSYIPVVSVGAGFLNFYESNNFVFAHNRLSQVNIDNLSVYTDSFLRNLGTVDCRTGAAVFFEDIDLGVGVGVQGLVSSTLAELQAIALALECVFAAHFVNLFLNSQAILDAFKGHSGVSGNNRADSITNAAFLSGWYLPSCMDGHFLLADGGVVFDVYYVVCHVHWEIGSGSGFLANLHSDVDWLSSFRAYTLHCRLPVAVWRHIYNKCYPSVLCLYCGKVEVSDHVFSCVIDDLACHQVLESCMSFWKLLSGLSLFSSVVLQFMSTCAPDLLVFSALYKGFEAVTVFHDPKIAGVKITDFVCFIYSAFRNNIWLVCAKHCAFMEKNGLISADGSFIIPVSGLVSRFSAGVVKLLGITEAFGILFGFCKFCLFFSGIDDLVSVNIIV